MATCKKCKAKIDYLIHVQVLESNVVLKELENVETLFGNNATVVDSRYECPKCRASATKDKDSVKSCLSDKA